MLSALKQIKNISINNIMKLNSILLAALFIISMTSCQKENSLSPEENVEENTSEVLGSNQDNSDLTNSQKTTDYRNKFIGTYTGLSTGTTTTYGPSVAGTSFKFVVTKVPYVLNKVKIVVSISGSVASTFTATANSTHLSFSAINSGNMTQTIKMFKSSSSSIPTNFIYTSGGGFTGLVTNYVVLNPTKL